MHREDAVDESNKQNVVTTSVTERAELRQELDVRGRQVGGHTSDLGLVVVQVKAVRRHADLRVRVRTPLEAVLDAAVGQNTA